MLTFMVGSKQAFEVSLADVSQTQSQGKNEVVLEFHVDDTTGANEVCLALLLHSLSCLLILFSLKWGFSMILYPTDNLIVLLVSNLVANVF